MICKICGNEFREGSAFCPFCGNNVEYAAANQNQTNVNDNNNNNNRGTGKPAKNKRPVINLIAIGAIALALIAFISIIAIILIGRNQEHTLKKFVKAYTEEDEDVMLTAMFPKGSTRDAELYMADKHINLLYECNDLFSGFDVEDLEITAAEEADKELCLDFEVLLNNMNIDLEYKELAIVTLSDSITDTDAVKNNSISENVAIKVLMYRIVNKWYIMPNALEDIVEKRQSEDAESAQSLYYAITSAFANETVYTAMEPYFGVVISLTDDFDYMPQAFQDYMLSEIKYIPELSHTTSGAAGFAFMIDESGDVIIYISSDTRVDEWELYPSASPDYYSGKKHELSEKEMENANHDKQFSYVRLIGEQSPILGYWQSDTVGMYIGYNASGGDEGFTVYLQSQDFGFRLLHSYNDYKYSGGNGFVQFTHDPQYDTNWYEKFKITVFDNESITLSTSDIGLNESVCLEPQEYTFKRGKPDKKTLSQYESAWIDGGQLFSHYGTYGNVTNLAYCSDCGCIHNVKSGLYDSYHNDVFVSLYDGKTLHYVFPHEGLANEEVAPVCYWGDIYSIDGNRMDYTAYAHGGGGTDDYVYFREGSEEAKMAEVLNAYYEYLYSNDWINNYAIYKLLYIDDDDVPELLFDSTGDGRGTSILCYNNGIVYDSVAYNRGLDFSYIPRQNKVAFSSVFNGIGSGTIGHLENGVLVEDYSYTSTLNESGTTLYTLKDNIYKEEKFNDIWNTYFDFNNAEYAWSPNYSSIYEAYLNFGVTEYGFSIYHIEAMRHDNGVLYIKGDDGKEISYTVADDCIWEFEDPFSEVSTPITYELIESDWQDCRSAYLEYGEELNYGVTAVVKEDQVIRVYTVHN